MSDKRTDAELMAAARHITKIEEVTILCDRLEHYHNEVSSVLELLDGLAEQWGDKEISQVISGLYCIPDADGGTPFAVDEGVNCIRKHFDVMSMCWARLRVLVK
jgi:hypothetical protein